MSLDSSRFIDTSNGIRIKVALLGSTIAGSIALAIQTGTIKVINAFGGGITSTIDAVTAWLSGFVEMLFFPVTMGLGFGSAQAFVETFGLLGQMMAGVYVTTLLAVLLFTLGKIYAVASTAGGG